MAPIWRLYKYIKQSKTDGKLQTVTYVTADHWEGMLAYTEPPQWLIMPWTLSIFCLAIWDLLIFRWMLQQKSTGLLWSTWLLLPCMFGMMGSIINFKQSNNLIDAFFFLFWWMHMWFHIMQGPFQCSLAYKTEGDRNLVLTWDERFNLTLFLYS